MSRIFRSAVARIGISLLAALALVGASCSGPPPAPLEHETQIELPQDEESLRFAVIGDAGTGGAAQEAIAEAMFAVHESFPFELVLMLGDNLYGSEDPGDYEAKFERPYRPLLDAGVKFYAALGNHDERSQRLYEHFNMGGETYYSFSPEGHDIRFFSVYSDYLDPPQLDWLEKELAASEESWKIAFFHHPLYSSGGRHGPNEQLREALEPLFVNYGVDVVLTGHEHFYERIAPQKGIHYFIVGNSGKLRAGDVQEHPRTVAAFDQGYAFMIGEISGPAMYFQTVQASGETLDSGVLHERTWLAEGGDRDDQETNQQQ